VRIVLDTCVLVAAMRSQFGASRSVLEAGLASKILLVLSAPLVFEYENVLTRPEHLQSSGVRLSEIEELLNSICAAGIEVRRGRRLRPRLTDPDDELVLETAVNGGASVIVTFNRADFAGVWNEFRIEVLSPSELLKRMNMI
jgi:putative PIN family toxin of toxin-antitoxin system